MVYVHRTASPDRYGQLKVWTKENRRNMTDAENYLWKQLMARFQGARFRRQHIIYDFIVDFVFLGKSLVIEVDGAYHSEPTQAEDDKRRTEILESMGFRVIRFSNEEVLFDIENVLNQISNHII